SDLDGIARPMFAGRPPAQPGGQKGSEEVPGGHSILPGARVPRTGMLRHRRKFDNGPWNDWRSRDMPLFLQGRMIWRVVDRLYDTGHPDHCGWTTMLECLPPEGMAPLEHPPRPFRPFLGNGLV